MAGQKNSLKTIAQNKKAFHDYFVVESMEAGIELCGTEVKSLRRGQCNLKDAWCSIDKGELVVNGMHISPYENGNIFNRILFVFADCSCINARSCACSGWSSRMAIL